MAARYGNASASSLVTQARSAYDKQQTINDNLAAFQFDLSPKDADAYSQYAQYLQGRIKNLSNDPSKALSLQRTLVGAQRSFSSSEISRASDQINQGNYSPRQKLSAIANLYSQAIQSGDENLAQRLSQQYDTYSITVQNQEQSAGQASIAAGERAQRDQEKQLQANTGNLIDAYKQRIKTLSDQVSQGGNRALGDIQSKYGGSYFVALKDLIQGNGKDQGLLGAIKQAIDSTSDESYKRTLSNEYDNIVSGKTNFDIVPGVRGADLNFINKQIQLRQQGQSGTRLVSQADGTFGFAANKITALQPIRNQAGKIDLVQGYGSASNDYSKVIKGLKAQGYNNVTQDSTGLLRLTDPVTGQDILGTPDAKGNIVYQAGTDDQGNAIVRRFLPKLRKDEALSQQEIDAMNTPEAKAKAAQDAAYSNASNVDKATLNIGKAAKTPVGNVLASSYLATLNPVGALAFGLRDKLGSIFNRAEAAKQERQKQAQLEQQRLAIQAANQRSLPSIYALPQQALNPLHINSAPAAVRQAASTIGSSAFNQTYLPAASPINTNNQYLRAIQNSDMRAYSIITKAGNYGAAVQQLRAYNPGINLSRDSAYDKALRAANGEFGGGKLFK